MRRPLAGRASRSTAGQPTPAGTPVLARTIRFAPPHRRGPVTRLIRPPVIGPLTRLALEFPAPSRRALMTIAVASGGALVTAGLIALSAERAIPTVGASLRWTVCAAALIALSADRTLPAVRALATIAVPARRTRPSGAARWTARTTLASITTGTVSTVVRRTIAPGLPLIAGSIPGFLPTVSAAGSSRWLAPIALRPAVALCFFVVGHDTSFSQKKMTPEMREGLLETE